MITSYYDVAVLGSTLEGLLSGALLAKRGFRVIVIGQGTLPPRYAIADHDLPREPFSFTASQSPIARKLLAELALHQVFRRRARALDPAFQLVLPKHRMDLPPDQGNLDREVAREFPDIKRAIDDFHRQGERLSDELDGLLERVNQWPPEGFFDRREFARATATLSFDKKGQCPEVLSELPEQHPFRQGAGMPLPFASNMDVRQLSPLGQQRLYDAWRRGATHIDGGQAWLHRSLEEKIESRSGHVRPREQVEAILLKRGRISGIRLAGSGDPLGCGAIIAAVPIAKLLPLLPDRGAFGELFERWGEPTPRYYRYTLNLVVDAAGVPAGMGRDVFVRIDPKQPPSDTNLVHIEHIASEHQGENLRLLTLSVLLTRRNVEENPGYLGTLRERLLESVDGVLPFLEDHLRLIDSPHDGRGAHSCLDGQAIAPLAPWTRGPSTMRQVYGYPVRGALGLCALPVRTPIRRLYLCSEQVAPGLGMEGSFLAAWNASQEITKANPQKRWKRREIYS